MAKLSDRIKSLRLSANMTQEEFGKQFGIVKSTVSLYESGKSTPNDELKKQICDYFNVSVDFLFGREDSDAESIKSIYGYNGEDVEAVSFPHKLANQIDYHNTKIHDLACGIGVDEKTILDWLSGKDTGYDKYYQSLSDFFKVQIRYWTSPHALSPGIEPNMEEYLLILLYREYKEKGTLNELYGSLEYYFPGINVVTDITDNKFLTVFKMLNEDNKDIVIGEMKKYLKEQHYEDSVAAESSMKEAK